jgi:hypothetical protein
MVMIFDLNQNFIISLLLLKLNYVIMFFLLSIAFLFIVQLKI